MKIRMTVTIEISPEDLKRYKAEWDVDPDRNMIREDTIETVRAALTEHDKPWKFWRYIYIR